jgi:hypothetical protein
LLLSKSTYKPKQIPNFTFSRSSSVDCVSERSTDGWFTAAPSDSLHQSKIKQQQLYSNKNTVMASNKYKLRQSVGILKKQIIDTDAEGNHFFMSSTVLFENLGEFNGKSPNKMQKFEDNIFLKIGSHLGDLDVDPNTPQSHGSFFSNEDSVNQSGGYLRRKGSKKRMQPKQRIASPTVV